MLDTRTDRFTKNDSEKSPESEIEKILGKNENVSHNLPPGFNSNKSAVTAQNSSGTTSDGNLQSIQANPAGAHHPYFGPPGTNYYAGHVSGQVAYGGGNVGIRHFAEFQVYRSRHQKSWICKKINGGSEKKVYV